MIAVYRVVNIEAAARGAALPAALVEACSSGFPRSPQRSRAPAALGEAALDGTKMQQQQGAQQQGAPRPTRWRSDTTLSPSFFFSSSTLLPSMLSSSSKRDASARQHSPFSSATHLPGARAGFSSRAGQLWDNLTLPVRQAQLREAKAVAELLPNRASFVAQVGAVPTRATTLRPAHQQRDQPCSDQPSACSHLSRVCTDGVRRWCRLTTRWPDLHVCAQFSPHGIQLMPKAVLQQQQQQQQASKGAAAAAPAPQSTAPAPAKAAPSTKATAAAPPSTQPQRRSASSTLHDWGAEGDANAAAELVSQSSRRSASFRTTEGWR